MGLRFLLVFGCLLVVFLSVLLMFLFKSFSFRGFCFCDSLPWKWVFSFLWCLAVFWLFFLVFCLCFCLGPALLEGFVFGGPCHENGSSLSSGCLLVVFLSVLLMFLFGPCSFRGFCILRLFAMKMGLRFLLVFGCLLVVFLSVLLMFLFEPYSFGGFCFWDSLPWKWVFAFFWLSFGCFS